MAANDQTWTVKAILDWCEGYLANKGDASPRHAAQYLLGEAMGLSRIELYTNFDKPLTDEERSTMREWVARRGAGEPLQLICGTAPFRHMVLEVAPGVLIPRPETEVLVSEVLAVELFEESLDQARTIALNSGFSEARIVQDLTNRPRILLVNKD